MLAARRIARVPGRMTLLIVSIKTISGMRGPGVPVGTRWASICRVWLMQPNRMKQDQRGNLSANVNLRCLVEVNTWGISPIRLLKTISEKTDKKGIVIPRLDTPSRVLNSWWRADIAFLHSRGHREGTGQNRYGKRISPKKVESQFSERFNVDDRGSKEEKRLVIILEHLK